MTTTRITAADLTDGRYTASHDLIVDGHLEIAANLGHVTIAGAIRVTGQIVALSGSGIEAGWGIKAGEGIEAGWGITCTGVFTVRLRVFAGLCLWRLPTEAEQTITCSRFVGGTIAYGTLIERGE